MPNVTETLSAAEYRAMFGLGMRTPSRKPFGGAPPGTRPGRSKYGNQATAGADGVVYDSKKEAQTANDLELARLAKEPAQRVVEVERQKRFCLVEKQEGERAVFYIADFVVTYADGRVDVLDTKSVATRNIRVYVLKRKLMLSVHGIRIREV